jgi:hypothetical protein
LPEHFHSRLEEKERAPDCLEESYRSSTFLTALKVDATSASLCDEPHFRELLRRVGLDLPEARH